MAISELFKFAQIVSDRHDLIKTQIIGCRDLRLGSQNSICRLDLNFSACLNCRRITHFL